MPGVKKRGKKRKRVNKGMIEPSNNNVQNCVHVSLLSGRPKLRNKWTGTKWLGDSDKVKVRNSFDSFGASRRMEFETLLNETGRCYSHSDLFFSLCLFPFSFRLSFFFHSIPLSQNVWYATPILVDLYVTGNDVESCQIMEMLKRRRKKVWQWAARGRGGGGL